MNEEIQYCDNERCDHCTRLYTAALVCGLSHPPYICAYSEDMRPDIVQCGHFKPTTHKKIPAYQPGRQRNGLYPGQIKEKK